MVKTFLQNKKTKELDAWKDVVKKINAHINGEKTFGFEINIIYISLENLDLHFKRVDHRAQNGGHDIPKEIIARRFHCIPKNLPEAMNVADNIFADGVGATLDSLKAWESRGQHT